MTLTENISREETRNRTENIEGNTMVLTEEVERSLRNPAEETERSPRNPAEEAERGPRDPDQEMERSSQDPAEEAGRNARNLAEEIIAGRRLKEGEPAVQCLLTSKVDTLCQAADRIRAAFSGDHVDLCTIINGKSGRCSEDCKYCAQSIHSKTGCETYAFLDEETILHAAMFNERAGVSRFSIVTSGRTLEGESFEKAVRSFERLNRECRIELCASMGLLSEAQFRRLRAVGVKRCHNNIESSRNFFPHICTTHGFDQKLNAIRAAQRAGMSVCSGGIIGMGESWQDRIDMAFTLASLGIRSIPLNVLIPVPGTPFQDRTPLSEEEVLRTVALFRFINPEADIRLAGGRKTLRDNGRLAFSSGASAAITGDMLTTTGSSVARDRAMLTEIGRDVTPEWMRNAASAT